MSSKKVTAEMQLNVSFVGNATKLFKDLEKGLSQLNLSSTLTKPLETSLNKSFKDTFNNLEKMASGLSKKGLSPKQYDAFFNTMNNRIEESTRIFDNLKESMKGVFNSQENKEAIKNLAEYKKQLAEIQKLASGQKGARTRQATAAQKMKDELGIDFGISEKSIKAIAGRKADKKSLTPGQQAWAESNGLDEQKLKRLLDLYKQILAAKKAIETSDKKANEISGNKTGGVEGGLESLGKKISSGEKAIFSEQDFKKNTEILNKFTDAMIKAGNAPSYLAKEMDMEMPIATKRAEEMAEGMQTLKDVLGQFGVVVSAGTIVRAFKDIIQSAFEFYKSLDSALNEIYVVSNLSIGAVNDLKTNFIGMAKETGMALDDVTRSAVLFYQQGLNTEEVMEMTRVTSEFAKVAGIDATDAADKLTAAVNGYCLAAEDASLVADKFNKVAAATAADIDELSTAFSKAAAQANQAGVSMDNYLAYIATMEEATREAPENIGTSLKTIFSRMQQIKTGNNTEDSTDVNAVETALKSVGVQLRNTEGQLRDLEEIFDELGPKWNSLDRNTQAYLGTIIAGTRQQSRFITLMQNWDRVLEVSEESANSAGQQALMHAKAMDSIESKLQQFQVSWQQFVSNLADSDTFKGVIDLLTKLMNVINNGSTPIVLFGTGFGLLIKNLTKLDGPLGRFVMKAFDGTKNLKKLTSGNLKAAASYIKIQKSVNSYNQAIQKSKAHIATLDDENAKLNKERQKAIKLYGEESPKVQSLTKDIVKNNEAIQEERTSMEANTEAMNQAQPELEKFKQGYSDATQGLQAAAIATAALAAILPGMGGNLMGAASGFLNMGTGVAKIAGLITTSLIPAFQAAKAAGVGTCEAIATAFAATGIGAIIEAIALVAMGAVMAVKSLVEAFGDQSKKIKESVNNVAGALETYNNALTSVKGADALLKKYKELDNKLYKTQKEQEKLNDLAQQLGDSLNIEVIEDKYGNLSVAIEDVNEKIKELKSQAKDAKKDLADTEQEEIEKYDHNGKVREFYEQYVKSHGSEIRNAVADIETGIDTKDLETSAQNVQTIMTNLKKEVVSDSVEISEAFGGVGVHWSLTEEVDSVMKSFSDNEKMTSGVWNDLYKTFNNLQSQIDDISYDEAFNVLSAKIKQIGEDANLTSSQIEQLTNAFANSLYGESNLNKTMQKYREMTTPKDYEKRLEELEKQKEEAYSRSKTTPKFWAEDDAEREGERLEREISLLQDEEYWYQALIDDRKYLKQMEESGEWSEDSIKAQKNAIKQIEEKYGFASDEEIEKAKKMEEILGKMSESSANFLNKNGLFDENANKLLEQMEKNGGLGNVIGAFKISEEDGARELTDQLMRIIETTDDKKLKAVAQEKLDNVFKNVQVKGITKWGELGEELDSISEDLRNMNSLLEEFNETGAFSLDTFMDLCNILDEINLEDVFNVGAMDKFINALDTLQLGFDESTGMISANGDALKSLGEIQEAITQAKIQSMADSLEADKAQLQAEIYAVQAEMNANNALIESLSNKTEANISLKELEKQGEIEYNKQMLVAANSAAQLYADMTTNSSKWAEASIVNAAKVGDAVKAAMTGKLGTENLKGYLTGLINDNKMKFSDTSSAGALELLDNGKGKVDRLAAINALREQNRLNQNTIDDLTTQMKAIESMQGLLRSFDGKGLGNLGKSSSGGSGKDNSPEQYIGKLKEIYNILNRIQVLEHRLSTLDAYADIAQGERYGNLLKERLEYNEELLDQYEFLTREQKQFTNGYKDFINSVEGLEGVFDFDQFGQIIINWDKYTALQDVAIDGEVTLKEKADDVYDTYTKMFTDLHGYFDKTIDYYKAVIDLQQEMVDSYISIQNDVADAVKEIYQKILDTKLDAIDQEKEALNELKEARERANKETKNARDVSNLQTNLQRAMMDTSGASDIAFIKSQKDIQDKLDEIAEDKYSTMLQDIQDKLDEEKDALQREFDDMFEQLDWLFQWIDDDIMGDESMIYQILEQTDQWNQSSFLERQNMLDTWKTQFYTYYQSVIENERGIYGIYDNIKSTRERIGVLDENLKQYISKGSYDIVQTLSDWSSKIQSSIATASSGGGGGWYGGSPGGGGGGNTYTKASIGAYNVTVNSDVKYGTFNNVSDDGVSYQPNNVGGSRLHSTGYTAGAYGISKNSSGYNVSSQTLWVSDKGQLWVWNGTKGRYESAKSLQPSGQFYTDAALIKKIKDNGWYATGGLATNTGPAWLDGTKQNPELVLNTLQTKHFIDFVGIMDKMYSNVNPVGIGGNNAVTIGAIEFQVDSMSSPEDGEKAFNMFVDKFKEIGNQTGIKINSFKNTL